MRGQTRFEQKNLQSMGNLGKNIPENNSYTNKWQHFNEEASLQEKQQVQDQ